MRIWLDPQKLAALNLTAGDVVDSIRAQNIQVAAGQIGAPPAPNADFQIALNAMGRLHQPGSVPRHRAEAGANGQVVRLGDVARVDMGAESYGTNSYLDNQDAVAIPVFQAPGSNALQLSDEVRATMAQLSKDFPQGMKYTIVYDPTVFVRQSIDAVVHTLLEAVLLVVLVVILFLQTWRASVIPLIAVPVRSSAPLRCCRVRVLDQHPVALRPRTRHRHRRRRRHRGSRERGAPHRKRTIAA